MTPEDVIAEARKRFKSEAYVANRFFADDDRKDDWALYIWEESNPQFLRPSAWHFSRSAPTLSKLAEKVRGE